MKLIWHLVRKDLHRLRWPVAALGLLIVAKAVFYAVVAGLLGEPNIGWLNRLQKGPEALLCGLMEPLIAYFLVGWLVFEDSPAGKDAHWITRPISGGQLFLAKAAGAGLMFVFLPVALTIPWWLAAGFEPSEIVLAAVELTILRSVLVAMGLACASLTDGFPRFTLWSLVGFGVFAMGQVIFLSERPEIGFSRWVVWCVGGGLGAVMLAGHQFVTRRQRKSLALAAIGIVLVVGWGGFWHWDLASVGGFAPTSASTDDSRVCLEIVQPAHYHVFLKQPYARLNFKISGVPSATVAANITGTGEWSFKGAQAWTSNGYLFNSPQTFGVIRRLLDAKQPLAGDNQEQVDFLFPFSPVLVRRTASEPATFHGTFHLQLFRGRVAAEMPLLNGSAFGQACTISELATGPLTDRLPVAGPGVESDPPQNAVSFILTERSIGGLTAAYFALRGSAGGPPPGPTGSGTIPLLVKRGTGEFIMCDWTRSDWVAAVTLNQTGVVGLKLVFPVSGPIRLDEFTFVAVRFTSTGTISREVDVDPLPFAEIPNGAGEGASEALPNVF